MFFYNILLTLLLVNLIFADVIITLPNGQIRGKEVTINTINKTIYAYQGIPYAAPPIGSLRFMPPVEPKNWEGIRDTTKLSKSCPQWQKSSLNSGEDCLYLNVYTSIKPGEKADKPVYVFIHGGAFIEGSGGMLPYYHVDRDIVAVLMNYRIGAFGFLSTMDEIIPGNYGLKDQLFALKWVQKNIHLFGGDPNKVTIGGQSLGSANVGGLVISPKAKGLFRAAIMESGSALCSWATQINSKEYAYQIAKKIDSKFTDKNTTQDLRNLLMKATTEEINLAPIQGPHGNQLGQGDIFAPVVEPKHDSAFITEFVHESVKNGKINQVPMIIGVNSEERLFEAADLGSFKKSMAFYDDNLPLIVNPDFNIAQNNLQVAGEELRKIYTNGARFEDHLGPAVTFKSDLRYTISVLRHAYLQSNYTDIYAYVFSYHGKLGGNNNYVEGAGRVQHSEELNYMWYIFPNLNDYPEADIRTHNRMLRMWTNFIKHLNPTPESGDLLLQNVTWPKVSQDNFQFLNINDTLQVSTNPKKYKEWSKIIDKYGKPPFNTY